MFSPLDKIDEKAKSDGLAVLILEGSAKDHDEIHKGSNSKNAAGEKPENAGSDFADDKSVNSEASKEKTNDRQTCTGHKVSLLSLRKF
jgi:hypothetical protein